MRYCADLCAEGIESWNKTGDLERFPEACFLKKCRAGERCVLHGADGALQGAVVLLTKDARWDGLPSAHVSCLHNLVSSPDARAAGCTILREIEALARKTGSDALGLGCIRGNEAINRFYERAGYLACRACTDDLCHGILRENGCLARRNKNAGRQNRPAFCTSAQRQRETPAAASCGSRGGKAAQNRQCESAAPGYVPRRDGAAGAVRSFGCAACTGAAAAAACSVG